MNYYDTAFAFMIYDVKEYEVGAKPNQESLSAAMLWLCYAEGAMLVSQYDNQKHFLRSFFLLTRPVL